MKDIQDMTIDEMKDEIKSYLALHNEDQNFVFISYSHRDSSVVYPKVLSWMRQGYNIYLDLDFENHGSDDNWVDIMRRKIELATCTSAVCFRSNNYFYSYAALIELLTMKSEKTLSSRMKNELSIDIIDASRVKELSVQAFSSEFIEYENSFSNLRNTMGSTFCANNPKEKKLLEEGFKSWAARLPIKERNNCNPKRFFDELGEKYSKGWKHFYPYVFFIMKNWFITTDLNGNSKSIDWNPKERFKELEVYQMPMNNEEEKISQAEDAAPKESHSKAAKKQQLCPQQGNARDLTYVTASVASSISSDPTLEEIRSAFSSPDIVRRFKPVRENMPRGGKGATDYLMAALLGGCNNIKADSPDYQINYYLYAVSNGEPKASGLGATWTWSSNCRKVLGLSGSGQIPAEFNDSFFSVDPRTRLSEIANCFVKAVKPEYQTLKNDLVIESFNRLSEFLS